MTVRRCDDTSYTLALNLTTSGNGVQIKGGEYIFTAEGSASGGATISLQVQTPNGTWTDISVYSGSIVKVTALPFSQTGIDLPAGLVRVAVTGGSMTGLYSYLIGLG